MFYLLLSGIQGVMKAFNQKKEIAFNQAFSNKHSRN
jgi:hypothetical protein